MDPAAPARVRFAPSPTGYLHVGGARTALFNWLFARHHGGVFILRIEDTDADRSRPELTTAILDELAWLGLGWEEGPFYQSERVALYRQTASKLDELGHAYPCFCAPEELQARRAQAEAAHRPWKYDGACRSLSPQEAARRRSAGRPFALRFRVPETGRTSFEDAVFGSVEVENRDLEDFVLLRSDGQPTYHLSVVADDLEMHITHVVRGADHLSNTPKQILMYRALGAPLPVFAHLPLILGPDKQRLSKRHGATAVAAYRQQGILPEALRNFLALLGWTPPGAKEIVTLGEMVRDFELGAVSKSNAVFDLEKLAWMNAEYLRHLPAERLLSLAEEELREAGVGCQESEVRCPESEAGEKQSRFAGFAEERARFERSVLLLQSRARTLKDFSGPFRAFFSDEFDYDPEARRKFWKDAALADYLEAMAARLAAAQPFDAEQTEKGLRSLAEEKKVKAGLLINAARVALTGQAVAPGLFEVMAALGRERVVTRLRRAAELLRDRRSRDS